MAANPVQSFRLQNCYWFMINYFQTINTAIAMPQPTASKSWLDLYDER